jgi:hypothetical protein
MCLSATIPFLSQMHRHAFRADPGSDLWSLERLGKRISQKIMNIMGLVPSRAACGIFGRRVDLRHKYLNLPHHSIQRNRSCLMKTPFPFEDKFEAAWQLASSVQVGHLEPVLAIRPGNPRNIRSLDDLQCGIENRARRPSLYSTCGERFIHALQEREIYDAVIKQEKKSFPINPVFCLPARL